MPTELEQQLVRFAETLDREAPAISVNGIVARGTVALDVHLDEIGERDVPIEVALTAARRPHHRPLPSKVALGAAAAAVLVVALAAAAVWVGGEADPASVPSTVPTTTDPPTSGGMWPQGTLEEVRVAQERADAGDPDDTWQLAPQLVEGDYWAYLVDGGQVELVDRFIREVLGWETYVFNAGHEGDRNAQGAIDGASDGRLTDQQFLRCAPGRTNPLYPPQPGGALGESCAPTLDDLTYESVRLDLVQLDRHDSTGIWVVDRWALTTFTQADPAAVEAQATQRVDEFLAARIAGTGADGRVIGDNVDIPLLYTTTAGAPYERYEIEPLDGPRWPSGYMAFSIRLFADGDATVVEQTINLSPSGELWLDHRTTTENSQPVTMSFTSEDGEVSVVAPSTWGLWWPGVGPQADVWFGNLWPAPYDFFDGEGIGFVDPVAYDKWCAENGGNPLLSEPANAAAIAQQLMNDADFETTAPVAAHIGGLDAISIDITLAPGGEACGVGRIDISRWVHELGWDRDLRLRLYLVDLPEGMSVRTLAITVAAPEASFDAFIEGTQPIIDSIEFHPSS